MAGRPGVIRRFFGFLWNTVDFTRRLVLNLLFLAIIAAIIFAWMHDGRPTLRDNTALVLDIKGPIVEQYTGAAGEAALAQVLFERERETQLRDVLAALDAAAKDDRIARVLVLLDDFEGAGLATLREVAAALERVKAAGKQVVAWGTLFDQRRYFIAAHANEVYLHPHGGVLLRGFGGYRTYYRDAFERVGVTVNVFKVGRYKSFAEPFTQNEPSPEALQDEMALLHDLWGQFTAQIEQARRLPERSIARLIDELPRRLAAVEGDSARLAVAEKLVDGLKTRDELRAYMIERGAMDSANRTFRQIALAPYVALQPEPSGDAVGVVVAQGDVIEGDAPQGFIGGRSTSELIRRARDSDRIKALVLRIDSPGGTSLAPELIRRELELTRKAGKPVIVSFGDAAASAGYWMALAADQIFADAATVTGSIGVFAIVPSIDKAMEKLSLHTGGAATTWLAGATDLRRPLDPRAAEVLQIGVTQRYHAFVNLAAVARKLPLERMNELAQGRVWSGRQAQANQLVDTLGGFKDALAAAAAQAKLGEDFRVVFVEREARSIDWLLGLIFGESSGMSGWLQRAGLDLMPTRLLGKDLERDLLWLKAAVREPLAPIAHCLCRPL